MLLTIFLYLTSSARNFLLQFHPSHPSLYPTKEYPPHYPLISLYRKNTPCIPPLSLVRLHTHYNILIFSLCYITHHHQLQFVSFFHLPKHYNNVSLHSSNYQQITFSYANLQSALHLIYPPEQPKRAFADYYPQKLKYQMPNPII